MGEGAGMMESRKWEIGADNHVCLNRHGYSWRGGSTYMWKERCLSKQDDVAATNTSRLMAIPHRQ
jgi:virulence-associated protein VapD